MDVIMCLVRFHSSLLTYLLCTPLGQALYLTAFVDTLDALDVWN